MVNYRIDGRNLSAALLLATCPVVADAPPSLELLEFLAEWQDDSGELVDPFALPENLDVSSPPKESEKNES